MLEASNAQIPRGSSTYLASTDEASKPPLHERSNSWLLIICICKYQLQFALAYSV